MIIIKPETIEVLNEFGRKTNPKSSQKVRALKLLAIDCKYERCKKKINPGDMLYVYNKSPLAAAVEIYTNLKMESPDLYEVLKDELDVIRIDSKEKEINGEKKNVFEYLYSHHETKDFIKDFESVIGYMSDNLTNEEKSKSDDAFKIVMEKTENKEDKKDIYNKAKRISGIFSKHQYVIFRRETEIKNKESNESIKGVFWLYAGVENKSYAVEAKAVSDEFGVLPLTSASAITEITPRV